MITVRFYLQNCFYFGTFPDGNLKIFANLFLFKTGSCSMLCVKNSRLAKNNPKCENRLCLFLKKCLKQHRREFLRVDCLKIIKVFIGSENEKRQRFFQLSSLCRVKQNSHIPPPPPPLPSLSCQIQIIRSLNPLLL